MDDNSEWLEPENNPILRFISFIGLGIFVGYVIGWSIYWTVWLIREVLG